MTRITLSRYRASRRCSASRSVCEAIGYRQARDRLGVNSTGLPFNSVMAIELNPDRTINPMVNAGAIATTSLVPGESPAEKFTFIANGLSRFAGRELLLDEEVYQSEAATNFRNRGIAHLLDSYGRMYCDPDVATDTYTRQCSLAVTAKISVLWRPPWPTEASTQLRATGSSAPTTASGFLPSWPLPASTNGRGTGCSRWDCQARAASAEGW